MSIWYLLNQSSRGKYISVVAWNWITDKNFSMVWFLFIIILINLSHKWCGLSILDFINNWMEEKSVYRKMCFFDTNYEDFINWTIIFCITFVYFIKLWEKYSFSWSLSIFDLKSDIRNISFNDWIILFAHQYINILWYDDNPL